MAACCCASVLVGFVWAAAPRAESDGKHPNNNRWPVQPTHTHHSNRFFFAWRPLSMCDAVTIGAARCYRYRYRSVGRRPSVFGWLASVAGQPWKNERSRPARHRMAWISSVMHHPIERGVSGVARHTHTIDLPSSINSFTQHTKTGSQHLLLITSLGYSGYYRFDAHHTPHHHPIISSGVCWRGPERSARLEE